MYGYLLTAICQFIEIVHKIINWNIWKMPHNYLSVLYKHKIQVENKNVGLKVGVGAQTYHCPPPPQSKKWGGTCPLVHPLASYACEIYIYIYIYIYISVYIPV